MPFPLCSWQGFTGTAPKCFPANPATFRHHGVFLLPPPSIRLGRTPKILCVIKYCCDSKFQKRQSGYLLIFTMNPALPATEILCKKTGCLHRADDQRPFHCALSDKRKIAWLKLRLVRACARCTLHSSLCVMRFVQHEDRGAKRFKSIPPQIRICTPTLCPGKH